MTTVYASLLDLEGNVPVIDVDNPPQLHVAKNRGFTQSLSVFTPFSQSVDFNVLGVATITVTETESTGERLKFSITFPNGKDIESYGFLPVIVPDEAFVNLSDLVSGAEEETEVRVGSDALALGIQDRTLTFTSIMQNNGYAVKANIINLIDAFPMIQPLVITNKDSGDFDAKWSAPTDTANYKMDYLAIRGTANSDYDFGSLTLSPGIDSISVPISMPTTNYAPLVVLFSSDGSPQIMPVTVTTKSTSAFTAKWSALIPDSTYKLNYIARNNAAHFIFAGRQWQSGSTAISNAASQVTVAFPDLGTVNYMIIGTISNTVDVAPMILEPEPTAKTSTSAQFTWSAPTDSGNYVLNFIAVTL